MKKSSKNFPGNNGQKPLTTPAALIFGVAFVWFSTHFGGGFASGAASGASIGGPWGALIGGIGGGLLSFL